MNAKKKKKSYLVGYTCFYCFYSDIVIVLFSCCHIFRKSNYLIYKQMNEYMDMSPWDIIIIITLSGHLEPYY